MGEFAFSAKRFFGEEGGHGVPPLQSSKETSMKNTICRVVVTLTIALVIFAASGCNSLVGTYSNANGSIVLDLKSGGKASLTFKGESKPCTYTKEKEQVTVDCEGNKTVFTIRDDRSLTGPGLIGVLKKST